MSKQSVFYEDRRYFALRATRNDHLAAEMAMLIALTRQSSEVKTHDPIFVFSGESIIAKYSVVSCGPGQLVSEVAAQPHWLCPVLVKLQSAETKAITQRVGSDDPVADFLLRHARRQVVDAVVASLTASRKEWDSAAHLIPVKLGDQLLDAYQLPYTDYHWSDVA